MAYHPPCIVCDIQISASVLMLNGKSTSNAISDGYMHGFYANICMFMLFSDIVV